MIRPALQMFWQARATRERRLLVGLAVAVALALLWQWGLAPALSTWRGAPQRQSEIDRQTLQMLEWQAQARQLKEPARIDRATAIAFLENSASLLLGKDVRVNVQGDQVRVTLVATPASGLAQWLVQSRENAQALVRSAQLQQTPAASPADAPQVHWRGDLTLQLP